MKINIKKTFADATEDCQARDSYLVEPRSEEINNIVKNLTTGTAIWIGLKRSTYEDEFLWQTDNAPLVYDDWSPGKPTEVSNCVVLNVKNLHAWINKDCDEMKEYICQSKSSPGYFVTIFIKNREVLYTVKKILLTRRSR